MCQSKCGRIHSTGTLHVHYIYTARAYALRVHHMRPTMHIGGTELPRIHPPVEQLSWNVQHLATSSQATTINEHSKLPLTGKLG